MTQPNYNERNRKKQVDLQAVELAPPHPKILELMETRKITAEAVDAFVIQPGEGGWLYPTPAGGWMWKNYDSSATPKYKFPGGKLAGERLYYAPDIIDAVQEAEGFIWMASGPPDVWALRSAGIPHALSAIIETSIPPDLAGLLRSLGVYHVTIAPDLDITGQRWARSIASRLANSGIELEALALPERLGEAGDIGKLWLLEKPKYPLERRLLSLPRFTPEVETPKAAVNLSANIGEIDAGYREIIAQALSVEGFKANGFSPNFSCIFHDDTKPSAALHKEKGYKCHVCGWVPWTKTGEALGLSTYRDWLKLHKPIEPQKYTIGDPGQLSNETRRELIKRKLTTLARVLDGLYLAGWEPGRVFTTSEAVDAVSLFGLTRNAVFTAFKNSESSICPAWYDTKEKGDKRRIHSRCDGPIRLFTLPKPSEIAIFFNVGGAGVEISEDCLSRAKDYRVAVYATMPIENPGIYSRRKLAESIGVSERTTRRYDEPAGLKVIPRHGRGQPLTREQAERLPEDRNDFPPMVWLEDHNRKKYPPIKEAGLRALDCGRVIRFCWRGANYYGPEQPGALEVSRARMPQVLKDWMSDFSLQHNKEGEDKSEGMK